MMLTDKLPHVTSDELGRIHGAFPHMRRQTAVRRSLREYYEGATVETSFHRSSPLFNGLRAGLRSTARDVFTEPDAVDDKLLSAFERAFVASSAEHQSPIAHPESLNVVLNQALYREARGHDAIVALACGSVKLDNEVFSRGLMLRQRKVPFLPASYQNTMTLAAPPMRKELFEKNLLEGVSREVDPGPLREAVMDWWRSVADSIAPLDRLWKQISLLNASLWAHRNEALRPLPNDYIMLPIERIVAGALAHDLEHGAEGWIHQGLLEPQARDHLQDTFNGVRSCWDREQGAGTFLFWALDGKGRPVNLFLSGRRLISRDGDIDVEITKDRLIEALRGETLIPAVNLCFLYMGLYLGMNLMGGILQVNYLPEMQQRLLHANPWYFSAEERERLGRVKTDLYVNFETRSLTAGGLLSLFEAPPEGSLEEYRQRDFVDELQGCLRFLHSLV